MRLLLPDVITYNDVDMPFHDVCQRQGIDYLKRPAFWMLQSVVNLIAKRRWSAIVVVQSLVSSVLTKLELPMPPSSWISSWKSMPDRQQFSHVELDRRTVALVAQFIRSNSEHASSQLPPAQQAKHQLQCERAVLTMDKVVNSYDQQLKLRRRTHTAAKVIDSLLVALCLKDRSQMQHVVALMQRSDDLTPGLKRSFLDASSISKHQVFLDLTAARLHGDIVGKDGGALVTFLATAASRPRQTGC